MALITVTFSREPLSTLGAQNYFKGSITLRSNESSSRDDLYSESVAAMNAAATKNGMTVTKCERDEGGDILRVWLDKRKGEKNTKVKGLGSLEKKYYKTMHDQQFLHSLSNVFAGFGFQLFSLDARPVDEIATCREATFSKGIGP
mmetsp:Transcript_13964/g.15908  ORF Transcript_13964/g.15908 Transcript_13964/m.15908 type:complete len:145 (-) Transcript_13964:268-702(-)